MRAGLSSIVATIVTLSAVVAFAQNCPLPPLLQPLPPGIDIFTDEQEADLGDAMAEQLAPRVKVIEEDSLTSNLRALGNRLVQHLPPTKLNFRFYLIDLPDPNAFSVAGGRVYVSRKLIALTKSEDELAAIVAHELGHIVTHQTGIYMTRRFREVLGVTKVGDRADVFAKFHQYLENIRRKPSRGESEEKEQGAADQVGVFAMFRTGYSPPAYIEILDRSLETHGKTGNWLSDFLGATRPEQHRLRELIKDMARLPSGCADPRPDSSAEAFSKWRELIIAYSDNGGEETLPGLLFRNTLRMPLRPDISHLRFSPDGKYLIAQDEGGIHILTRQPLAVLFYVPALDAYDAEFTPDSQSFIFYTHSLRVETWSIESQTRTAVHEILVRERCMQSALSDDANTLACLNLERDLVLLDVATNAPLLTKKQFFVPTFAEAWSLVMRALRKDEGDDFDFVQMQFSPDGRYFLAGHASNRLAYDMTKKQEVSLPRDIREHLASGFVFLTADKIVVVNGTSPASSAILRFPSGERIAQLPLALGLHLHAVARGEYLLAGPLTGSPLGLMDLATKQIRVGFKRGAADVYDGMLANERLDGEVALFPVGESKPIATITLPQARLGKLRAAAVSSDLNWVAISNRSRGALWNVSTNVRVQYLRGFDGAWLTGDGLLYADFPKFQDTPRAVGIVPLTGGKTSESYKVGDIAAVQVGAFLVVTTPREKNSNWNSVVEVRDIASNKPLWSRHFSHEVPGWTPNSAAGTILLRWSLAEPGAHDELQSFPDLKGQASKEDDLFEVLDIHNGGILGKILVKTNKRSILPEGSFADGDWVVVSAAGNQVLAFSLASGAERGHFFGTHPLILGSAGVLALENDAKEVDLYDLNSQQLRRRYIFADPVSVKQLSADGKRLLVLTASQTAYLIDTSAE
jgi:hypothetical protein